MESELGEVVGSREKKGGGVNLSKWIKSRGTSERVGGGGNLGLLIDKCK